MSSPSIAILVLVGVLVAAGVYLALARTLSRIFIGLSLVTHGVNLLTLAMGGAAGLPPLLGREGEAIVDPLPQAMILTSIVLSLGTTAFGLALAYRSWLLTGNDEVADDIEDRRLARLLHRRQAQVDDAFSEGTEDRSVFYDRGDLPSAGMLRDEITARRRSRRQAKEEEGGDSE